MVLVVEEGTAPRRLSSPALPGKILSCYARTEEDLQLFSADLASRNAGKHLDWEEALEAFPHALIPAATFELGGAHWELITRQSWDGRTLHLAAPAPRQRHTWPRRCAAGEGELDTQRVADQRQLVAYQRNQQKHQQQQHEQKQQQQQQQQQQQHAGPHGQAHSSSQQQQQQQRGRQQAGQQQGGGRAQRAQVDLVSPAAPRTSDAASKVRMARLRDGSSSPPSPDASWALGAGDAFFRGSKCAWQPPAAEPRRAPRPLRPRSPYCDAPPPDGAAGARRKYVRDLAVAIDARYDSLARYKALSALIEHCKARARAARPPPHGPGADWGREPARSLLGSVLDVGEALAGFGNARFPERGGEARAVVADDYRRLLSEYLAHLGGVLVPGACQGIDHNAEAELRSVRSLLAARCAAYKLAHDQPSQPAGPEGAGGACGAAAAASGPQACVVFNSNSNRVCTGPVTASKNGAWARSRSKALNNGVGAALAGVALFGAALLFRALARGGRGGGECGGDDGRADRDARAVVGGNRAARPRLPRGGPGRELALATALSACSDELRKAGRNDSLLQDDWRLGRRVRLGWPLAAEHPAGYEPLSPDACDVSGVLQELYGRR